MRKTISIFIFLFSSLFLVQAHAQVVQRALPACVTKELLSEMQKYILKGDRDGMTQLILAGKCTVLSQGEKISVISTGLMRATIRYNGVKLYTPTEAVR